MTQELKFIALTEQWKARVLNNADNVDPDNKEDWESLALGFALGKGLITEDARRFVVVLVRQNLI